MCLCLQASSIILQKRWRQRRIRSVMQIKSGDLYICTTLDKWHFFPFKSPSQMPRKIQTEYKIMSQPSILLGGQDKIKPNIYYFIFLAKTNFQQKQTNGIITWSSLDKNIIFYRLFLLLLESWQMVSPFLFCSPGKFQQPFNVDFVLLGLRSKSRVPKNTIAKALILKKFRISSKIMVKKLAHFKQD